MPIPLPHAHRYVYHFTHIDNLPGLLQSGLLANNHQNFPRHNHRSVAENSIQARRTEMVVTCGPGGVVHDYVPLYFGSLSLMLLGVLNRKNVDQQEIIYFEYPISLLERQDVVFTDAAANTIQPPIFYSDPAHLANLNWHEIDSLKWSSANESLRHQRMAEVLVYSYLPLQFASRVVVWNEEIMEQVRNLVNAAGVPFPPIEYENPARRHYFTKFMEDKPTESLVTGPKGLAMAYQAACQEVEQKAGQYPHATYATPKILLEALRANFGCLPETQELVGLRSANGIHKRTVDVHTQEVVAGLRMLPEFLALDIPDQNRLEFAAFLHDIGKGPKSRWQKYNGVQQVDADHPVKAMPMMVNILTEYVQSIKLESARLILKLVLYHDLVGDVLGKQRDAQQIIDIANDQRELDMLFALGKADATSLVESWWNEDDATGLYNYCLEAIEASHEA